MEEVEGLRLHEEVIPSVVRELADRIRADGVFMHPIIVDEGSLVVLDGMHRVAAAREIGYKFIPVCLVDYNNPSIEIGAWYRLLSGPVDMGRVPAMLGDLGLSAERAPLESAHGLVEGREAIAAIFSKDECFLVNGPRGGIKEAYDMIKKVEVRFLSEGCSISYDDEDGAMGRVRSGEAPASIMTPTISKREVIETALAGKVFIQKSTRHLIPARPMFINAPAELLTGALGLSEANDRLVALLSSKELKRLPPGQVLDRRYGEELYIFL
ncbi:MAG: ParB N-terminal domain-containing protein [Candidatus Bathyarchaeia archaeon]